MVFITNYTYTNQNKINIIGSTIVSLPVYMSRGTAGMLELEMTTVLIVVSLSVGGHGLLHFPCNDSLCPPFDPDNCSYGVIKDANDCCSICANGEGDKCGGAFNVFGDCTNGTKCMVEVEFGLHYFVYIQKSGICKYTGTFSQLQLVSQARPSL